MKNLNTILLGVLVVAVGVLYYLHFSGGTSMSESGTGGISSARSVEGIVFINTDSLFQNYDKYKELSEKYEAKVNTLQAEYQNRAQGLQREIANYQQGRNNLTIGQAQAVEEDLMQKERNLVQYQQSLQQQLLQEESEMIDDLYSGVTDYLKEYGASNELQVVLTYSGANRNILFASDSLDITQSIISGLNSKYAAASTTAAPVRADSTAGAQ